MTTPTVPVPPADLAAIAIAAAPPITTHAAEVIRRVLAPRVRAVVARRLEPTP